MFYKKAVVGSGSTNSFVVSYPISEASQYDEIVEYLYESFKTPNVDESY